MMRKFKIGMAEVDPMANEVQLNGVALRLEPKTIELLHLLATRAGQTVTKEELLETLWPGIMVTEDSITRCVSQLRKAFNDPELIETITKRGYRVNRAVEFVGDAPALYPAPALNQQPGSPRMFRLIIPPVVGVASILMLSGNPYFPYWNVNTGLVLLAVLCSFWLAQRGTRSAENRLG